MLKRRVAVLPRVAGTQRFEVDFSVSLACHIAAIGSIGLSRQLARSSQFRPEGSQERSKSEKSPLVRSASRTLENPC